MNFIDVKAKWEDSSKFYEISTSGSTGQPKRILLEKARMEISARKSLQYFQLKKGDKVLLVLPCDKVGGAMLVIRSIIGRLHLQEEKPRLNPLKGIEIGETDFCSMTPSQLTAVLSDPESKSKLSMIKKVLLGGSALPPTLYPKLGELGTTFYHGYGMTETISHVAVRNLTKEDKYYEALEGVHFSLGREQRLIIHANEIIGDELITNDIAALGSPTQMRWLGRIDNVVNSGGIKLIVEEIEEKIKKRFDGEFYLIGEADALLGERLVMISTSQIDDEVFQDLDKFEKPKLVYRIPKLKYTKNGKLRRIGINQLRSDR